MRRIRARPIAWAISAVLVIASLWLVANTLEKRYERDISRLVLDDNVELLVELRRRAGLDREGQPLVAAAIAGPSPGKAYIVVSIDDHRLWYKHGDSVLFTAAVATGSGKVLERVGAAAHWKFETPRGRLEVVSKETDPVWIPPDWHFIEQARIRGLGVVQLHRGQALPTSDGGSIAVAGSDVVRRSADGSQTPIDVTDERELVSDGNIIIPPFGTNQRTYKGVLGTHRLNLGAGYALHGTNKPESIGRSVSHGCVRLHNEDIARLHAMVSVGTPVFIY
jgi:hypothetical protein